MRTGGGWRPRGRDSRGGDAGVAHCDGGVRRVPSWPQPRLRADQVGEALRAQLSSPRGYPADVSHSPIRNRRTPHESAASNAVAVADSSSRGVVVDPPEYLAPRRARSTRGACSVSIQRVAKGHYIVRWKFPDGRHPKRRIRGTSDREAQREAQAVHVELQKQARMGAFGDGTPSRMLLGEWCAEWARAERRRWSPSLRRSGSSGWRYGSSRTSVASHSRSLTSDVCASGTRRSALRQTASASPMKEPEGRSDSSDADRPRVAGRVGRARRRAAGQKDPSQSSVGCQAARSPTR